MPVRLFHEWKHLQTGFVIFVDLQLVVIVQLVVVIQVLEELILFILFLLIQVIQVFEELEVGIKNKHDRNLRRTVISVYQVARCNYINIT